MSAFRASMHLHVVFWLVLAWKHGEWDSNARGVRLVDHSWVAGCRGGEACASLRRKVDNLASPAETKDSPFVDR